MKKRLICVLLLCVLVCSSVCLFAGCEKEEEINWWEDYDNLVLVMEDHRSEPSKVEHQEGSGADIPDFVYDMSHHSGTCDLCAATGNTERIPKITLLHKGESVGYFFVTSKQIYTGETENYEDIPKSIQIFFEGEYRVDFGFYYDDLAKFEDDRERMYHGGILDISIIKGEQNV